MRAFTIKHTGKTIWCNMFIDGHMQLHDKTVAYTGILFFRKKDAQKYLNTFQFKEHFEVIGVTIDKSKKDNRVKY